VLQQCEGVLVPLLELVVLLQNELFFGGGENTAKIVQCNLPERCHGNDGVPKCLWYAGEFGVGLALLRVEHDRRKHDDRHRQREQKKTKFTGARLECISEDPQTLSHMFKVNKLLRGTSGFLT